MAIAPKIVDPTEDVRVKLPQSVLELLDAYVGHLGHGTDRAYVIAEAIKLAVTSDKDFAKKKKAA